MIFLYAFLAFLCGFLLAKLSSLTKTSALQLENSNLGLKLEEQLKAATIANQQLEQAISSRDIYQRKLHDLELHVAGLKIEFKNLEQKNKEFSNMSQHMQKEFENLAFKILEKSQTTLAENNQEKIKAILTPLNQKISDFQTLVKHNYEHETRDKISLKTEVQKLLELNQKLSLDARNLTAALKGDVKFQGNWGEIILEKILEKSGLREGIEYQREKVLETNTGNIIRPDVIINLPQNKQIIIDAKISLKSYEEYSNTADANAKEQLLASHIKSVKQHIKSLSEKNYLTSDSQNSLDFLILFIPIEGSYNLIMQYESEIFWHAFDKKILILGPTTLNATLQIIASLWKQEKMSKNAEEIAKQSGALYDRFVDFLNDLEKVRKSFDTADKSLESAFHKLQNGKFSMFNRFEKLKSLGAKNSKEHKLLLENEGDS